jgi:MtN3 and saliva related transmembrane protein
MDSFTTVIGFTAATCTTACYLPQLYKSWKTRSTGDLSLVMMAALAIGVSLWIVYGVMRSDVVVIAANVATLILVAGILMIKLFVASR